jgi:hypothetical protein
MTDGKKIIKLLSAPFLLLVLNVGVLAQTPEGLGLTVVSQNWRRDLRNPQLERDPVQETNDSLAVDRRRIDAELQNEKLRGQGMPPREPPSPEFRTETGSPSASYVYEVKLRNGGEKEISSVTLEYVFFTPGTETEVGRRRFTSKKRIRAGKTVDLVMRSAIPPTGTIDASKAGSKIPEKYTERIIILSVEYTDGSKWPSPDDPS